MQLEFWYQRWQQDQTGFHLTEVNAYLLRHWNTLGVRPGSRVLVPLCGKSVDMAWLASNNYPILGVEYSRKAVEAFYTEQGFEFAYQQTQDFTLYSAKQIDILQGDFFNLDAQRLSDVVAVYDRASLVALPEDMRLAYADLLIKSLPLQAVILLITVEYEQSEMQGPPFSVTEDEVQRLFSGSFDVELREQQDMLADQPRFRERGLGYMHEKVYKLTRKA